MDDLTPPTPPEPARPDDSIKPDDSARLDATDAGNPAGESPVAPLDDSVEAVHVLAPGFAAQADAPTEHSFAFAGPPRAVYAAFWRRFWAYQADLLIVAVLASAFIAVAQGENAAIIALATWVLYFVGFGAEGGTPGKRMFGLRITRLDGSLPGFARAALRELIGRPLSTIPLYLGYLWMLDDASRQTWHDRMADTIVVREVPVAEGPDWAPSPPWIKPRASSR